MTLVYVKYTHTKKKIKTKPNQPTAHSIKLLFARPYQHRDSKGDGYIQHLRKVLLRTRLTRPDVHIGSNVFLLPTLLSLAPASTLPQEYHMVQKKA